ncbi:bacterial Ig-like domain, group 2 [Candidatus Magnetomorum sp. HK-1]|nr:bacterial Ig-like domain, group 2 [Candidatus Magnetomorum sp. HK-1]
MSINGQFSWMKRCLSLLLLISLSACGAGGDYSRPRPVQKGVFLDSAVSGLRYVTETLSGTTDVNGTFEYRKNETIKFYIADIFLGETQAKAQITPIDLFTDITDIADPSVTNMCRFLQALDINNDPDDGIEISIMVQNALNNQNITLDFQQSISDFESDIILSKTLTQMGYALPGIKAAQKHLRQTLYGELQSIEVKTDLLSTPKGMPIQLHALGTFEKTSEIIDITNQVNWSSSNNSIATIDSSQSGLLNSFATGEILVFAILDDVSNYIEVEIKSPILTGLRIVPQNPLLHPFHTQQFYAMGTFSDDSTRDITAEVTWASKNVMIATVGSISGLVRAISEGKTQIIAEYEGKMASSDIMVNNGLLTDIQIYPDSESAIIAKGFNKKFHAIGVYSDETRQDITEQVFWESGHNEIAKVSNVPSLKGLTEAIAVGGTKIFAKMGDIVTSIDLTVSEAILDQIRVLPVNKTIPVYSQEQFQAQAIFSDLTVEDVTDQVLWVSDEPQVAAFFDEDIHKGLLSTESPGVTTIRAMYQGLTGATFLTVSDAALESIIVEPSSISVPMGGMHQFTASGIFSDDTRYDITDKVDWTVSKINVARVSNDTPNKGLMNTVAIGTTYVRATFKNVTGYADLTVRSPDLLSIRISPENISIERGASQQLQATGYYTDNAIVDITHLVEWKSSQPEIIKITGGLIEALAIGNANITASLSGISRFTAITVY